MNWRKCNYLLTNVSIHLNIYIHNHYISWTEKSIHDFRKPSRGGTANAACVQELIEIQRTTVIHVEAWKLVSYRKGIAEANGVNRQITEEYMRPKMEKERPEVHRHIHRTESLVYISKHLDWFAFQAQNTRSVAQPSNNGSRWFFSQGLMWTEREDNSSPLSTSDLKIS